MTNSRDIGLRGSGAGKGDAPRHDPVKFRKGYEAINWQRKGSSDGLYVKASGAPFLDGERPYAMEIDGDKVYFTSLNTSRRRRRSHAYTPDDVLGYVRQGYWVKLASTRYKKRPSKRAVVALAESQTL